MKILIADDDKALVHILQKRLMERGFEIIAAHDAIQAWMSIQRHVPEAVVLDMSMPGGTGMEVLRKLKQFPKTRFIPTIIISAFPLLLEKVKDSGADEFLSKPFTTDQLLESLARVTGTAGSGTEVTGTAGSGAEKAPQSHADGFKILIADDDATTRHTLQAMLCKWGYDVIAASRAEEAWQILQNEDAPRLAILDWMMPDEEGIEICRRLREQIQESYTYVLLLTSRGDKADLVQGMTAGADDYVVKPFDPDELKVRVAAGRRILGLQEDLLAARARLRAALAGL